MLNEHIENLYYTRAEQSSNEKLEICWESYVLDYESVPFPVGSMLAFVINEHTELKKIESKNTQLRQKKYLEVAKRCLTSFLPRHLFPDDIKPIEYMGKVLPQAEYDKVMALIVDIFEDFYEQFFLFNNYSKELNIICDYLECCEKNKSFFSRDDFYRLSIAFFRKVLEPTIMRDTECVLDSIENGEISVLEVLQGRCGVLGELEYKINNEKDLCLASLRELLVCGGSIKRCAHCGYWFVEREKNEKYCRGQSPKRPELTCKEAARLEKESVRMSEELNRRLHSRRQAFDNAGDYDGKEKFNLEVKKWRQKMKSGEVAESEFIEWINSTCKRKYKTKEGSENGNDN